VGVAFEPVKDLTFSSTTGTSSCVTRSTCCRWTPSLPLHRYGQLVRCGTLPIAVQNTLNRCAGLDNNSPAIGYIIQTNDNIGKSRPTAST
jgi:hypothetical protein